MRSPNQATRTQPRSDRNVNRQIDGKKAYRNAIGNSWYRSQTGARQGDSRGRYATDCSLDQGQLRGSVRQCRRHRRQADCGERQEERRPQQRSARTSLTQDREAGSEPASEEGCPALLRGRSGPRHHRPPSQRPHRTREDHRRRLSNGRLINLSAAVRSRSFWPVTTDRANRPCGAEPCPRGSRFPSSTLIE